MPHAGKSERYRPTIFGRLDELSLKNSSVVYVTVVFRYDHKVWQQNWPKLIKDLLLICEKERCKLVFFDNIYMYDKDGLDGMTETTAINPPSEKGKVPVKVAQMILDADKTGKVRAPIARSAA